MNLKSLLLVYFFTQKKQNKRISRFRFVWASSRESTTFPMIHCAPFAGTGSVKAEACEGKQNHTQVHLHQFEYLNCVLFCFHTCFYCMVNKNMTLRFVHFT